ncbi:MAG: c-type cytochrome [Aureispira sp.]|nr:c-type cytochrome [Aureispira sp.]
MNNQIVFNTILCFCLAAFSGCVKENTLVAEEGEEYAGGETTVFNTSRNAFSFQAPNLDGMEELEFFSGNSFFNQSWVSAPASTSARDGLGPMFNALACSGCHFKDGRGRTPAFEGEFGHGLLIRLSISGTDIYGGTIPEPTYGGQLGDNSVPNVTKEGTISIIYTEISGTFEDGTSYSLRKPTYDIINLGYGAMDAGVQMSPRVANQIVGLGLLEAISEADILANVDESDADGDGISGRANQVHNRSDNSLQLGRFGWKSNQPNIRQQVAGAFVGDMGITSKLFPDENCTGSQNDCNNAPNGNNVNGYELDDDILDRVVLYVATLGVPGRRDWTSQDVLKGKQLFLDAGCQKCHIQKFKTGTHPTFSALSHQTIYPYTDLLLHDMGEGLADNRPDYKADGQEWRTAPLWGIGLIPTVNDHSELLHDGRARNVSEAILWHGGESEKSKQEFLKMTATEREQLIQFVNSL